MFQPGQERMALALKLQDLYAGMVRCPIIMMELVTPDQLLQFKVDAFVNTHVRDLPLTRLAASMHRCSLHRILEIVLGEKAWEELVFAEITA